MTHSGVRHLPTVIFHLYSVRGRMRQAWTTTTRAEGTIRLVSLRRDDLQQRFLGLVEVLTR